MRLDNRSAIAIAGLLCMILPGVLLAQSTPRSAPPPAILLRHATLLDGVSPNPQMHVVITVRGGRIESVRADHDGATPGGGAPDSVIDLRGAWVMPGLIDAHAHLGVSRVWGEPDSIAPQRALDAGVTTVRSLGNVPGFGDVKLRHRFLEGGARSRPGGGACRSPPTATPTRVSGPRYSRAPAPSSTARSPRKKRFASWPNVGLLRTDPCHLR
jgi:hypothetical protein